MIIGIKILRSDRKDIEELLGKKKEKIHPKNDGDYKKLAEKFITFFEYNVKKTCEDFKKDNMQDTTNIINSLPKLSNFLEVEVKDHRRIKNTKPTNCDNDSFL